MRRDGNDKARALGLALAVVGIAGLGMLVAKRLQQRQAEDDYDATEGGNPAGGIDNERPRVRSLFRIVTIKAHPANVEKDWAEFASTQGTSESRSATMTFRQAPGTQGTELRADLTYTTRGGKLGTLAQRMAHKSPGQMLGQDLKRFKMTVETGEVVKSDASIHKHMHQARPDDRLGNANLLREATP